MKKWIFSLLLITSIAMAGTYTRQAEDNIVDGLKINAADLNNEFDAIQSAVNAIDTTNVTDGSLTSDDYAATSTAVITNRKLGCETQRAGTSSVNVLKPCELSIDGVRSILTADTSVSLITDLDTGAMATSTFYYIYGSDNSGGISFEFSTTEPDYDDARKSGTDTKKYIAAVRTMDDDLDIIDYQQIGERFIWNVDDVSESAGAEADLQLNFVTTVNATSSSSFVTPTFIDAALLQYEAFASSFSAQCNFVFPLNTHLHQFQAIVVATGSNGHIGYIPFPVEAVSGEVTMNIKDVSNCESGRVTFRGWIDPPHFHR